MIRQPRRHVRRNAKNYTHDQAQKRLDETVAAFNTQVENALKVDSVAVDIYHIDRLTGRPCSCIKTDSPKEAGMLQPVIPNKDNESSVAHIEFQDTDIFGNSSFSEMIMNDDEDSDLYDSSVHLTELGGSGDYSDVVAPGSHNCGICYRTTLVPGFKCYGKQRVLLTHYDVSDANAFLINSTFAPHRLERQAPDGFIRFTFFVPKYFAFAKISIRDNLTILREMPFLGDNQLTAQDLRNFAGHEITISIRSEAFTHVVIEFDLGTEKIHANIGGESMSLDYDRLQTLSDIPVVLGPSVPHIDTGDIICIPDRNLYLKVRDKERKITATQRRLEWVCTTRVLQPQEPTVQMNKGYKLL